MNVWTPELERLLQQQIAPASEPAMQPKTDIERNRAATPCRLPICEDREGREL